MVARSLVVTAVCIPLVFGCAEPPVDETQEVVGNLVQAGFPAEDIMVVDGKVYVGRDSHVTLAASREMLEARATTEEQYRTTNLVSQALTKICINGSTFTGVFSTALDLAIQNYDEQPFTFAMARTPSTGCSFTINAVIQPNVVGGSAGFPSGGVPYHTINIGGGLAPYSIDVIEHVITHEIGHTLGLRHSDYYNRSISCGTGGNEGDAGVGAILIPGTPSTAVMGGSLMNSCFRSTETGEFTSSDITALMALYTPGRDCELRTYSYSGWVPVASARYFGGTCAAFCDASGPRWWNECYAGATRVKIYDSCMVLNQQGSIVANAFPWYISYSDSACITYCDASSPAPGATCRRAHHVPTAGGGVATSGYTLLKSY